MEVTQGLTSEETMSTWGPIVLGALFACLGQGYIYAMSVEYFTQFARRDHWMIRGTIALILLSTTAETGLAMAKTVKQTVQHPGDLAYVLTLSSRADEYIIPAMTNLSIMICQAFLCWRCIRFARTMRSIHGRWASIYTVILEIILPSLWICVLIGSVFLTIRLSEATDIVNSLVTSSTTGDLSFWYYWCFTVLVELDIIIVVSTSVQLRAARTGFKESNTILNTIVNVTIRNGVLIFLAQFAQLVLYRIATEQSFKPAWVFFPHSFVSRLYAVTVLSTLTNPRYAQANLRRKQADQEAAMIERESIIRPRPSGSDDLPRAAPTRSGLRTVMDFPHTRPGSSTSNYPIGYAGIGSSKGGMLPSRRGSFGRGNLEVTLQPRVEGCSEEEGPVSFTAALFGIESPLDGVGVVRRGGSVSTQGEDFMWTPKDEQLLAHLTSGEEVPTTSFRRVSVVKKA